MSVELDELRLVEALAQLREQLVRDLDRAAGHAGRVVHDELLGLVEGVRVPVVRQLAHLVLADTPWPFERNEPKSRHHSQPATIAARIDARCFRRAGHLGRPLGRQLVHRPGGHHGLVVRVDAHRVRHVSEAAPGDREREPGHRIAGRVRAPARCGTRSGLARQARASAVRRSPSRRGRARRSAGAPWPPGSRRWRSRRRSSTARG